MRILGFIGPLLLWLRWSRVARFLGTALLLGALAWVTIWLVTSGMLASVPTWGWGLLLMVCFVIAAVRYQWRWTGFVTYRHPKQDDEEIYWGKTLWDVLQLLVVPAALTFGAFLLTNQQAATQQEIAEDNQREVTLKAYFDDMSALILDEDLLTSAEGDVVRTVARTRTLSTLRQLDGERKGLVIQFLNESLLIGSSTIVSLSGSDLSEAHLVGANLSQTSLNNADLRGAVLNNADLRGVDLRSATLTNTFLTAATMANASLSRAHFDDANLIAADLSHADLQEAWFKDASLSGANLRGANLKGTSLSGARLIATNLNGANLTDALMSEVNLGGADLSGADLTGAYLVRANLTDANLTNIFYDDTTIWPTDFTPPPSRPSR